MNYDLVPDFLREVLGELDLAVFLGELRPLLGEVARLPPLETVRREFTVFLVFLACSSMHFSLMVSWMHFFHSSNLSFN